MLPVGKKTFSLVFLLTVISNRGECCKPDSFHYIRITEKLARPIGGKPHGWMEACFIRRYGHTTDSKPLILANVDINGCDVDIPNYENDVKRTSTIEIHGHYIPVLSQGDISNLHELTRVFMQGNHIQQLNDDIFIDTPYLQYIDFSDNDITEIPGKLFGRFSISHITLANNDIQKIAEGAFADQAKLKEVNLSRNKIQQWDPNWFRNSQNVQKLIISFNQLTDIPQDAFNYFKHSVIKIDLSHNQIRSIPLEAFKGMNKLTELNLSYNDLPCPSTQSLDALPRGLQINIVHNEHIECRCLNEIQKWGIENDHFHKDVVLKMHLYLQVKCNEFFFDKWIKS